MYTTCARQFHGARAKCRTEQWLSGICPNWTVSGKVGSRCDALPYLDEGKFQGGHVPLCASRDAVSRYERYSPSLETGELHWRAKDGGMLSTPCTGTRIHSMFFGYLRHLFSERLVAGMRQHLHPSYPTSPTHVLIMLTCIPYLSVSSGIRLAPEAAAGAKAASRTASDDTRDDVRRTGLLGASVQDSKGWSSLPPGQMAAADILFPPRSLLVRHLIRSTEKRTNHISCFGVARTSTLQHRFHHRARAKRFARSVAWHMLGTSAGPQTPTALIHPRGRNKEDKVCHLAHAASKLQHSRLIYSSDSLSYGIGNTEEALVNASLDSLTTTATTTTPHTHFSRSC